MVVLGYGFPLSPRSSNSLDHAHFSASILMTGGYETLTLSATACVPVSVDGAGSPSQPCV